MSGLFPSFASDEDFPSFEIETRVSLVSFNSSLISLLLLPPGTSLTIEPHGLDAILKLIRMLHLQVKIHNLLFTCTILIEHEITGGEVQALLTNLI